jgi:general secretion pathway protein E
MNWLANLFPRRKKADAPLHRATDTSYRVVSAPSRAGDGSSLPEALQGNQRHVVASTSVAQIEDLPPFTRTLNDELGLRDALRSKLCAIELRGVERGGMRPFAVVIHGEMLYADELSAAIRQLTTRFVAADPLVYIANPNVMEALSRGETGYAERQAFRSKAIKSAAESTPFKDIFVWATKFGMDNDASDIHTEMDWRRSKTQLRFRIDGRLVDPASFRIDTAQSRDMFAYVYNMGSKSGSENSFASNQAQQCQVPLTIDDKDITLRWASQPTHKGLKIVLRLLHQNDNAELSTLESLGYTTPQCSLWERVISKQNGGTLVGGVVNSGKSKTLHTVLERLPRYWAKYSAEEPVESELSDTAQISISRSLHERGTDPFLPVKRQLKRMDLDAFFQAELRDFETAAVFRDVCESGHRGFGTVHAPSVFGIFDRLSDAEFQIPRNVVATPGFLNLLVYQALLPRTCPHCAVELRKARSIFEGGPGVNGNQGGGWLGGTTSRLSHEDYMRRLERVFDINLDTIRIRNPEGCVKCRRDGLPELNGGRGRIVVAEMLEPDTEVLYFVREKKSIELRQYVKSMRTARFDEEDCTGKTAAEMAMFRVADGTIDPREVEVRFGTFENYEIDRAREARVRDRSRVAVAGWHPTDSRAPRRVRPVRPASFSFGPRAGAHRRVAADAARGSIGGDA